ncbi:hypothetical protein [Pseudochrobactrum asaccharolyticum]|uniref:Uncharacterized protein n=1 Tax=Pseudochrobactrum asaccharolyticum TaxID=354351 RepID=A0A366DYJ6_9HYPH|nr:hypothetical protein [Pseudochrobactrum asaccharolyticum]RBO94965.1 hypothetical protein DFR47_104327 [Pseudochrobactrum asaccharolyticum]
MSTILSLSTAARRPDNISDNTAIHKMLLDELNAEAQAHGWAGSAIDCYRVTGGIIGISVIAGVMPATIDDLRAYRDNQKLHEEELTQPAS